MVQTRGDHCDDSVTKSTANCVKVVLKRLTQTDLITNNVSDCDTSHDYVNHTKLRELTQNDVIIKQRSKSLNTCSSRAKKRKTTDENETRVKPKRVTRSTISNLFNGKLDQHLNEKFGENLDEKLDETKPKCEVECAIDLDANTPVKQKVNNEHNMFGALMVDHNDNLLLNTIKTYKSLVVLSYLNHSELLEIMCAKKFRCVWSECGLVYKNKEALAFHYKSHTGFHCDKCGQLFYKYDKLKFHTIIGRKSEISNCEEHYLRKCREQRLIFACDFGHCSERFETALALEYHYRRHIKRAHNCLYCEKSFTIKRDLKNHLDGHRTNVRPFKCYENNCGKQFASLFFLVSHQTASHPDMHLQYNPF